MAYFSPCGIGSKSEETWRYKSEKIRNYFFPLKVLSCEWNLNPWIKIKLALVRIGRIFFNVNDHLISFDPNHLISTKKNIFRFIYNNACVNCFQIIWLTQFILPIIHLKATNINLIQTLKSAKPNFLHINKRIFVIYI